MTRLLAFVLAALLLPSAAFAITARALNGSVEVDAGGYAYYTVKVPPILPGKPRITAHLTASGGAKNDIRVMVFTQAAFAMWEEDHGMTPIYDTDKQSKVDFDLTLGHPGTYVVVLSNTFSPKSDKTVSGRLGLTWDPPYAAVIGVGVLVAGVVWVRRRKGDDAQELSKAA